MRLSREFNRADNVAFGRGQILDKEWKLLAFSREHRNDNPMPCGRTLFTRNY